jgi:hypothetical protein
MNKFKELFEKEKEVEEVSLPKKEFSFKDLSCSFCGSKEALWVQANGTIRCPKHYIQNGK